MARVGTTLASTVALGLALAVAGVARPPEPAFAQQGQPAKAEGGKVAADKPVADKAKAQQKPSRKAKRKEADAEGGDEAKTRDPADAQKTLAAAQKSLDGNKADIAVGQIDALIGRGGLDSRSMARALSIRGQAYRKQGKPAQAIADLQSALWLKNGLSESERASAVEARSAAYREAGLGEAPGIGGGAPASPQQGTRAVAAASAPVAPSRVETAAVPEQRAPAPAQASGSGGGGGFFANLFGGGGQKAAPVQPATTPPPASPSVSSSEVVRADPAEAKGKALARAKVASAASAPGAARPDTPPVAEAARSEAAPPKAEAQAKVEGRGRLALRLAAQRTESDARAVAERVKREHPETAGRRTRVDETVFGGMGTFYQPSIGPFADMDGARKLCATIRGKGIDCEVVSR